MALQLVAARPTAKSRNAKTPPIPGSAPMHVLLFEEGRVKGPSLEQFLRPCQGEFQISHARLQAGTHQELSEMPSDVAVVDMPLDRISSLDAVRRTRAALPGIPLLVLTETTDEALGLQAMREGAHDCFVKSKITTSALVRAMRRTIERQKLQHVLEETRQQQARLTDEFLSHVSHELRSPLAAMHQFVSLLLDNIPGELNAEQREFLEIVARNTSELRGLIDDLLDATRAETGKLTVERACISASQLIHAVMQRYSVIAQERGLRLSNQLPFRLPAISADPQRTRQILSNLLDNACKFTPAGGEIAVTVAADENSPAFLRFSVADSGPGIPAESLPHVFDRLYQGAAVAQQSRRGLGLGLHITRELVTRHGGTIWVESQFGKGTTFHFTLPIFSVESLIAPLIRSAAAAGKKAFALITVLLTPPNGTRQPFSERFLAAAGQTLTRCTLPDVDVLLPRMDGPNQSAKFLIFASANDKGARVLSQRVQEQLQSMPEVQAEQTSLSVSTTVLRSSDIAEGSGPEELLRSIATKVQRRIEDQEGRTQNA